jgi:site-specific DNA recombinase
MPGYSKSGKNGRPLAATPAARAESPRVAFYTRISTDEDHQKYSLGAQKERLEAFCKAQWGDAWQLHKVYRDTESGTHMNRPGLEEMLYEASTQAFNTLLVFRVDRLSRKVRELAQMVDELTKNGVTLRSITEPFDTSNAAGKMMLQMLGVFAEFEHATIVERTKVGMEKKAKGGNFVGGNVPYGYQLDPEKGLAIHEEEALIVRKMFKMYALGREGASAICKQLNDAGHRNRNGRKWGRRVVLYMLKNPVVDGGIKRQHFWRCCRQREQPSARMQYALYSSF